jgi:hypothetical protein
MEYFCGIDPGFTGAICIMNSNKEILHCEDIPIIQVGKKRELNEPEIKSVLTRCSKLHVAIEKSQVMPGQGISSSGRYMASYGFLRGVCVGIGIPYSLIHPKTWKKVMLNDMPKEKAASIQKVGQLYPNLSLPLKKDHGKADAVLICLYNLNLH